MRLPHSGQKRGGSSARPHPGHSVPGLPQPVQWVVAVDTGITSAVVRANDRDRARAQMAAVRAPIGMRRSSSICMSSSAERPRVVR